MHISVFTDPLCCWSWGSIPHWDALQQLLGKSTTWSWKMGGLIPSWDRYRDEVNAISKAAQMGPIWMHAGELTGRPIRADLWATDPPASSYPACVAVKAAHLQSPAVGLEYFRRVHQACMQEGRNIGRTDVLLEIAAMLSREVDTFNLEMFHATYNSQPAIEAFRYDLREAREHNVSRFPTLIIRCGEIGLHIPGWRTTEALIDIVREAFGAESVPAP